MARTEAWDYNGTAVEDPSLGFPQGVVVADKKPNGASLVLLQDALSSSSLGQVTTTGVEVLATVPDTRSDPPQENNSNASVQGIGLDGVVTLDSGDSGGHMVLRFWRNPLVLRIGPNVKRARFTG